MMGLEYSHEKSKPICDVVNGDRDWQQQQRKWVERPQEGQCRGDAQQCVEQQFKSQERRGEEGQAGKSHQPAHGT